MRLEQVVVRLASKGSTQAETKRISETNEIAGDAYAWTPMKTRLIETAVGGSPARPKNDPPGANRSSIPRTIADLIERFGSRLAGSAILTLITVVFLAAWFAPEPPVNLSPRPENRFVGWLCPPGRTFHWYVSGGQWKADARTALAMLQYYLSPDLHPSPRHSRRNLLPF